MINVKILYEDKDLIVCVKPQGMPSQSDRSSDMDLVSWLKNYLKKQNPKVIPYIGIVHRLDRPVGGIMVYAKTKQCAADLSAQFAKHHITKKYLAVLTGCPEKKADRLENYLLKDSKTNTSSVVKEGGKRAALNYEVLAEHNGQALIKVELETGRHHQIRVQMAHLGTGIFGDTKYNRSATQQIGRGKQRELCLFSTELVFWHPTAQKEMEFSIWPENGMMARQCWQQWMVNK